MSFITEFSVRILCGSCGEELDGTVRIDRGLSAEVDPCDTCMRKAVEQALEDRDEEEREKET